MTILGLHALRRQLPNSLKKCSKSFSHSSLLLAKANENPYTNTILLPKTKFPLRAEAAKREHLFKDRCTKDLYPWQVNLPRDVFWILYIYTKARILTVKEQSKRCIHSS
jgi:hypothetical protein